jgi:archaellum component FlaG (FlaF/FlaG flagellin family)
VQDPPVEARRPSPCRRHASSRQPIVWIAALLLLGGSGGAPGAARASSKEQMQGLDEQVQEIKSDVLSIAAELGRLEEKLLYPSNTEVSLFVSLTADESFRLDSVQVQIDGEAVARHIYSFKELEALQKGGVQRIYTGNVPTGEHRLEVTVAGKLPGGEDFSSAESFGFSKQVDPKIVEIQLAGQASGASIQLGGP